MNDNMGTRLAELRKSLGLTQTQFADRIGLKFSTISMVEIGKTPLTEPNIRLICLTFDVNETWLRTGEGVMILPDAEFTESEKRLIEGFRKLSSTARRLFIEYLDKMLADEAALRRELPVKKGESA
jgi:transcriptional regulator with XRE-family HTH domain